MTTDDLRARAEMVAKRVWPDRWDAARITYPHAALQHYRRGAFVEGALWHAAQQPSLPHRDELAAVILDATVPFRGPGGQTVPYVQPVHYAMADAVLALLNGADDG